MSNYLKVEKSRTDVSLAKQVAKIGVLSACAIILMYLDFPIPLMPPFLKFDFAEVPALLGAFSLGPFAGVLIEFIKNLAHLPVSSTGFVGELANFLVCGSFVLMAGLIYQYRHNLKQAIIALSVATVSMAVIGVVCNYYINLPFYINVMGFDMDKIIGITNGVGNTLVHDMFTFLLWVIVPFNLVKGLVTSLVVGLIYRRLNPLLHS